MINWFKRSIGYKSLFISLLIHFLCLWVLCPVLSLPIYPQFDSRLIFLGTTASASHYDLPMMSRKSSLVDFVISRPRLNTLPLQEIYEVRLGEKFLPGCINLHRQLSQPFSYHTSHFQTVSESKTENIFFRGKVYCFPDGKKYHFEPMFIHYDIYRNLMIHHKMREGYVLKSTGKWN